MQADIVSGPGDDLQSCYASVAAVADKWLDVLFTEASSLPDDELVELIAENRSMSKTLAEYEGQKSTSISTAKRLAEFLGEGMVKDKGLSCRFIISTKPHGAPVTERAVPVAIFSADPTTKRHYLQKWLKDSSLTDFELRSILDWSYYIERLGSVIQKLITIPAALQKVANPVPRIRHPDWLFRRVANLEDKFKQHKLEDMFARQKPVVRPPPADVDMEDFGSKAAEVAPPPPPKPAPNFRTHYRDWIAHMKPIWRTKRRELVAARKSGYSARSGAIGNMLSKQTMFLSSKVWDIVQIAPVSERPGEFKVWLLIDSTLQSVRLRVPREFLVNFVDVPDPDTWSQVTCERSKATRTLPRNQPLLTLTKISTSEEKYIEEEGRYAELLNGPNVDGVYELQIPLIVRALLTLGSSCVPDGSKGITIRQGLDDHFQLDHLRRPEVSLSRRRYLDRGQRLRYAYIFHATTGADQLIGLFLPDGSVKVHVVKPPNGAKNVVAGRVEGDYKEQLESMRKDSQPVPTANGKRATQSGVFEYVASVKVDVLYHATEDIALRALSRELAALASQKQTSSMVVIHSPKSRAYFDNGVPAIAQFPFIVIQSSKADNTYPALTFQVAAARRMVKHYLRASDWIKERIELADRFDVPVCNLEHDVPMFLADIDFARRLHKADLVLWWSPSSKPDLGGREADANSQQLADDLVNPEVGRPGAYSNACLEVDLRNLAVDAVLQSALVYELEGGEGGASIGFEEASHNLDEYRKGTVQSAVSLGDAVLPTHTFNIVRGMVKAWSTEASKPEGAHWRLMIDHFWRWISSPAAKLYDPALSTLR